MKSGIIIDIEEIKKLDTSVTDENYNYLDTKIKEFIKKVDEESFDIEKFISGKVINVTSLSEEVFPVVEEEFDFFISYSYSNVELVNKLANYLSKLGFKVFVDNQEWKSVYTLLKKFDEKICRTGKNLYSYDSRNITTANMYSMLSIALTKVISRSKYFVLVKSEDLYKEISKYGFFLDNTIENKHKKYTISPWLEYEIEIFNLIVPYNEFHKNYPRKISENIGIESKNSHIWKREYNIQEKYFSFLKENDLNEIKEYYDSFKEKLEKEKLEKKLDKYLINNRGGILNE